MSGGFIFQSFTFRVLSNGDLVVWKIHENIEEIRSVDNFGIHKACNVPWARRKEGKWSKEMNKPITYKSPLTYLIYNICIIVESPIFWAEK